MQPVDIILKVNAGLGLRHAGNARVRGFLATSTLNVFQCQMILVAECSRIGMPKIKGFTLDKRLLDLYKVGRADKTNLNRYDDHVLKALLRARKLEKNPPFGPSPERDAAEDLVALMYYFYELREQKYAGK